MRHIT
jgi:hypothetical protein